MSHPLLLVPPHVGYLAGPLAGPAMLAGVGAEVGVPVDTVDINAHRLAGYVKPRLSSQCSGHRLTIRSAA